MSSCARYLAVLLLPAALLLPQGVSADVIPERDKLLSHYTGSDSGDIKIEDLDSEVATDGKGNFVAVWTSNSLPNNPAKHPERVLLSASSSDGGATWSTPLQLNVISQLGLVDGFHPHIATNGVGTWIASWVSASGGSSESSAIDIVVSRSTNNGQSWSLPVAIPHPPGHNTSSKDCPAIAGDSTGTWIVVWHASVQTDSDKDIYVSRSLDDGIAWAPAAMISKMGPLDDQSGATDAEPSIATDGAGNWLVVWHSNGEWDGAASPDDFDIVVSHSFNGGDVWGWERVVNSEEPASSKPAVHPKITTDGAGNWITCWQRGVDDSRRVAISHSSDLGQSWSAFTLPIFNDLLIGPSSIATDGKGNWLLAMQVSSGVYGYLSTDLGQTWSPSLYVSQSMHPAVAIGGDGAAVTLHSLSTARGEDIYFRRSTDSGETWGDLGPGTRLDDTSVLVLPSEDSAPLLATDGKGVWVSAWITRYGSTSDPLAAWAFSRSEDDGDTWSTATLVPLAGLEYDTHAVRTDLVTDGAGTWLLPVLGGASVLRSIDNGVTWSDPIPVSDLFGLGVYPEPHGNVALASNGDGVWVLAAEVYGMDSTWFETDYYIYLSRSEDNGITWSSPVNASYMSQEIPISVAEYNRNPTIAADGAGGCVVAWTRFVLLEPTLRRATSSNNGMNWSTLAEVDTQVPYVSFRSPVLRTDGAGNWVSCWLTYASHTTDVESEYIETYQLYTARSTDGGDTWTLPQLLEDGDPNDSLKQDLDLSVNYNGGCMLTWSSKALDGDLDVFAAHSTDGGTTWSPPFLLNSDKDTEAGSTDRGARIASAGPDKWMVVWESNHDLVHGGIDDTDIHYTRLGAGWPSEFWQRHSMDMDGDSALSLAEVLRVIQIYNAGAFSCAEGEGDSEDGFSLGDGTTLCPPHAGDYNPQDWRFTISELLRMIQFYNLGGLHPCPESEDGYCPGPQS